MAKLMSTRNKVKDIFRMDNKYHSTSEEIDDKMSMLFRGLTANLEQDIMLLTPKERIDFVIKLTPHFSRYLESGRDAKVRDNEFEKTINLFREIKNE